MMNIKHYKSHEWKPVISSWKQPHPQRIVVIAPLPNKEQRRVMLIHPTEGASVFELDHKDVVELVREVGTMTAVLIDLAALGVAPLPPPTPPPGPIGDDAIYAAALNVVGATFVLGQLVNVRATQHL
jgi:hypothetical protein